MEWLHVLVLALIQGLTEFLPISSSAHLILPAQLLGWPDQGLAFDVGVHVGSLLAVVVYFRTDIRVLAKGWFASLAGRHSSESKLAWLVVLATIPAFGLGGVASDLISHYGRSVLVIAGATLIFGGLLWWADHARTEHRVLHGLGWQDAVIIGLAQAVAMIPGTSRSGITITAALMLGFERQAAARFSFLMSIPVIAGAGLLLGLELPDQSGGMAWQMIAAGALVSALSAWACIHLFLKLLDRIGMMPFVIYRMVLGLVLLAVYFAV